MWDVEHKEQDIMCGTWSCRTWWDMEQEGSSDDRDEVRCPLLIIITSPDNAEEKEGTEIIARDVERKEQDSVCRTWSCVTWSRKWSGTWRTTTGVGGRRQQGQGRAWQS